MLRPSPATATDLDDRALLQGLSAADIQHLVPLLETASFQAGDTIFAQGAPAKHLYVLEQGEVELRNSPDDGGSLTITTISPLGVFGWSAVLGRQYYSAAAVCVADGQALRMDGGALRRLLRAQPRLGRLILGRLALALAGRPTAAAVQVPPALLARLIRAGIADQSMETERRNDD